jgi:hypothetical protein
MGKKEVYRFCTEITLQHHLGTFIDQRRCAPPAAVKIVQSTMCIPLGSTPSDAHVL